MCRCAARSQATADSLGASGGRGVYVGYSMGGRLCLRLALERPDVVEALVLVSASPGLERRAARAERRASDEELAAMVERDGVDAFLDHWLAQPLFAGVPPAAPGLRERHALPARYLAHCLRTLGTGAMEPLWGRLGGVAMPVALVTGTGDAKFDDIARQMLDRLPGGAVHSRLDGGHALPLEQSRRARRIHRGVRGRTRLADPQPGGEQHGQRELEPHGPDERRDEAGRILPREHGAGRRDRERRGEQCDQRERRPECAHGRRDERARDANHVQHPRAARADPNRKGPFAGAAIGVDVAHVVGEQDGARRQAGGERRGPRRAGQRRVLYVRAAQLSRRSRRTPAP